MLRADLRLTKLTVVAYFLTRAVTIGEADAQIINQYFPQGVPGYDTGLGVTVQSRARDQFVPQGIQLGDFLIRPALNGSVGYNSNVAGLPAAKGSLQIDTSGSLSGNTNWLGGGISTYFSFDQLTFPEQPNQNQTTWVASIGGTRDIGRNQVQASYSHFNLQQTAADLGSLNFQTPLTYHVDDFRSSYKADFGRISVTPGFELTNFTFDQAPVAGLTSSQSYRDRVLALGNVAFRYEFSTQKDAVVVLSGYDTHYTTPQLGQPGRNNKGASILAGFEYTSSGVFRYRGLIGFEQRNYASHAFSSQSTPIGEADVIWAPTELTTITLSGVREIGDAASETTVGFAYTTGRIVIDHEYKRNILLQANVGVQSGAYTQGGGSETIAGGGGHVAWLVDRNVHVVASYDYAASSITASPTNFVGNPYHRSILLLQLNLAL